MPIIGSEGAASSQGFGQFARTAVANYIEEVFSTWLYTGNGSTQTITNGIDLAGKGGLVWTKYRNVAFNHCLIDTARGASVYLRSNSTGANVSDSTQLSSFNSSGYTLGDNSSSKLTNESGGTYASWTFREQPKFFDVVTYTGNGVARSIPHNLGSVPGCIIVKCTSIPGDWFVYHRSATGNLRLNTTAAQDAGLFFITGASATTFDVGSGGSINGTGDTYVAYVFAHNAGGFGLTGTDNVISCGSYTGNGSTTGPVINLGYEPQWVLIKDASGGSNWIMLDTMRGLTTGGADSFLNPNTGAAENTAEFAEVNATGFQLKNAGGGVNTSGNTYIYIAIRRGPMKVPTTGTSVYTGVTQAASTEYSVGFPADLVMAAVRSGNAVNTAFGDRLRGKAQYLVSSSTAAEGTNSPYIFDFNTSQNGIIPAFSSSSSIYWNFRRAPGFFDEVCYTGTGSAMTVAHNLGVPPELIITKQRSGTSNWNTVYGITATTQSGIILNSAGAGFGPFSYTPGNWILNAAPTATTITIGSEASWNGSGSTYVAYLFASCPGVSKCTAFTGTGTLQTINCGFTSGARFVLIKRTDAAGDWYVWDSSRGLSSSNDPYLLLNSTAAEVTSTNWVDTTSTGFQVTAASGNNVNISGASYIALAIS